MRPEEAREMLGQAIRKDRLASSFLVYGGTEKERRDLGDFLARRLCFDGEERQSHPDVRRIVPEKRTLSIDEVRQVKEEIYLRPYSAERKVYIFEIDAMKEEAANAFLKILEEPPPYGVIAILSSTIHLFLPTIISRCQRIRLSFSLPETGDRERLVRKEFSGILADMGTGNAYACFREIDRLVKGKERQEIEEWLTQAVWCYRDSFLRQEGFPSGILADQTGNGTIDTAGMTAESLDRIMVLKERIGANINTKIGLANLFLHLIPD